MTTATLTPTARAPRAIPIRDADRKAQDPAASTRCAVCHLRDLCLPSGLSEGETDRLDSIQFVRRSVKAGQALYRQGDKFNSIHAVRAGTFKTSLLQADGGEHVSGFHIGGELMGLDGAAHGVHASSAIALEDAETCAIPYGKLSELAQSSPGMQQLITRLMSREIVREHSLMMLLGSMSAEERLATFLLNMSRRLKARGYSPSEFHLRMSRAEIGSYLGLTLETVSRTFSSFQQQGLLEVDKRHIRIVDLARMASVYETKLA